MEYQNEKRECQNCKNEFTIEPEDFNFYEKIKVPPPTFCPECRFQRRMVWRNDWHLFKKREVSNNEEIFSLFPEESPVKIYDWNYWISDAHDSIEYGKNYDFSRPFFEQFKELLLTVPLPAHSMINIVNCHYCTNANDLKGCYLVRGASYTEDSAYLIWDQESKECFDSHMTHRCELSYGNVNTIICYKTFFSVDCESCHDLVLCKDCVGCNSCIASVGLRNKSYCIFNKQYSKEEYKNKLIELDLGSDKSFKILKNKAYEFWLRYPLKYIHGQHNVDVSGDYIYQSKNTHQCFRVNGVEDSKYIQNILTGPVKDCYDYANYGDNVELIYESLVVGTGMSNVKFSSQVVRNGKNLTYCFFCFPSCSDLFGCIGLRKKQYCILNKQYTKEEYEELLPKIIKHMNDMPYVNERGIVYKYGEFFPSELSPFPYMSTAAYEFFPLSEEEAKNKGFNWYSTFRQDYKITIEAKDIVDNIKDSDKNIINEVIGCSHAGVCQHECTKAFRIIEKEFDFCKRMNIPLPRLCPNCRHYERLSLRNSPSFTIRNCMCDKDTHGHTGNCTNEFETSYDPKRPEIVYCEECYKREIY